MNTSEQKAFQAGKDFAAELNDTPIEAQNWGKLFSTDELPEGDYVTLRDEFGEVTLEMESAYRNGFNEIFVQVDGDNDD